MNPLPEDVSARAVARGRVQGSTLQHRGREQRQGPRLRPGGRQEEEPLLAKLLEREDVIGLGESYWQAVLQEPERFLPNFAQTLMTGKTLEGHSAGASDKKLAAYIAAGISSCHEPINADQVLERLRQGLHILVREGSIRRDLEEIVVIPRNESEDDQELKAFRYV